MPIYLWRHRDTGEELEVVRQSYDDYLVPPQEGETELDPGDITAWEKLISKGIRLTNPNKGNW